MTAPPLRDWSRKQWAATVLLAVFCAALVPPGVWLVNEPVLVGGFPLLYLWAVGWAVFACIVLFWAAREDLFGITPDQVPPELADREDASIDGDAPVEETIVKRGDR